MNYTVGIELSLAISAPFSQAVGVGLFLKLLYFLSSIRNQSFKYLLVYGISFISLEVMLHLIYEKVDPQKVEKEQVGWEYFIETLDKVFL